MNTNGNHFLRLIALFQFLIIGSSSFAMASGTYPESYFGDLLQDLGTLTDPPAENEGEQLQVPAEAGVPVEQEQPQGPAAVSVPVVQGVLPSNSSESCEALLDQGSIFDPCQDLECEQFQSTDGTTEASERLGPTSSSSSYSVSELGQKRSRTSRVSSDHSTEDFSDLEQNKLNCKSSSSSSAAKWEPSEMFLTFRKYLDDRDRDGDGDGFQCNVGNCNMRFDSKWNLDEHRLEHYRRAYQCDFEGCTFKCKYKNALREHKKTHPDATKPFECVVEGCTRRFAYRTGLETHMSRDH